MRTWSSSLFTANAAFVNKSLCAKSSRAVFSFKIGFLWQNFETSLQKSSEYHTCVSSTSTLFWQFWFSNWQLKRTIIVVLIDPKIFNDFTSTQSCLEIILSNWWCLLLFCAWWIYQKYTKQTLPVKEWIQQSKTKGFEK